MDSFLWPLAIGLLLVLKGGDLFVTASLRVAGLLRMPKLVVGSTVVSLATTSPELVVSITAGWQGEAGLAIGNAVGSCLCNLGLILGVTAILKDVKIHLDALRAPLVVMVGSAILLLIASWDLVLRGWHGLVLIAVGVAYFVWDFRRHWNLRNRAGLREAVAIEQGVTRSRWPWLETPFGAAAQFIFGALVVVLGSRLLVEGAVGLATQMGVPSIVIGLTVVAIGTSLPELITALGSARHSVSDLAVGNVLGANIANLTFIVGAATLFDHVPLDRATQLSSFPVLLILSGVVWWRLKTQQRLTRREGLFLVACYVAYLLLQAMIAERV